MHPLADTFVPPSRRYHADRIYPLICDLCRICGQVQLRVVTDPHERYSEFDYSYTSSNSAFSRNHWIKYAREVAAVVGLPTGALVVEIGSNDGYLCEQFGSAGYRTFGVDPSKAMCDLAAGRGIKVHNGLFDSATAERLTATLGEKPGLIVANNVFNHANDPLDFAAGVKALLSSQGTFVFELPYWFRTIVEGKFDQVYHEHVSYFTVHQARRLFERIGMVVVHAEEVDYHGGSIRVFVRHEGREDDAVSALVAQEKAAGLFDTAMYGRFMSRIRSRRDQFLSNVLRSKGEGAHLVCVGAAAKANTFLNYYRLDATIVDWVTDASPSKIGKYTPATRIPIAADAIVAKYDRVSAIITSWNLAATLRENLLKLNGNIQFLNPYEAW